MEQRKDEKPKVGLLITGHSYYWDQFPELKGKGIAMANKLQMILKDLCELVVSELVDSPEKSKKAGQKFLEEGVHLLLVFPVGYTPSMQIMPIANILDVPIRILNTHEDRSYDYENVDTAEWLHHEGICCIPEFSGALKNIDRQFRIRTGHFDDERFIREIEKDILGASAAWRFKNIGIGLIGEVYTGMTDMPIDEHRLLRATGKMLVQPEVEEIEEAYYRVDENQLKKMFDEIRELYDVADDVTNEHLRFSSAAAIAYEEVIKRYNISAFGYYWWGEKEFITQLRSQSNVAVSRLAAMGRPGVTEGDVKSAMGMKIMDLLGAGGMFVEFFSIDYDEDFILMGHDGPANINMAKGKPKLQHLPVHHGKSGHGLGIDFDMEKGPVTLINLTQFGVNGTFKIIYVVADIIPGAVVAIGNPNCRIKLRMPTHEFIDKWCQEGPSHHFVIGYGDQSEAIETFAESMKFQVARIQ